MPHEKNCSMLVTAMLTTRRLAFIIDSRPTDIYKMGCRSDKQSSVAAGNLIAMPR